jgi:outer membrane protein TolC
MFSKSLILIVMYISINLTSVLSQTQIEQTMITIEEAIFRALKMNNQVKASDYALERASWNKKNAWTQILPVISLHTQYAWIDDSTFALRDFSRYFQDPNLPFKIQQTVFQNSFFTYFNISVPIFNLVLINRISQAGVGEEMAEDLNESARRTIIFQVISGYINVLKQKDIYKLQEDYLELSRLNYEKAERLFNAGRYSKTDALRWKVEFQQQQSVVTTSQSNLRSSRIVLSRLLNAKQGEFFEVENQIPMTLLEESERLLELSDLELLALIQMDDEKLMEVNADLSAAKKNENLSLSSYRNTYSNYFPVIDLNYNYGWQENSNVNLDSYSPKTLMVNFRMPIFTSFQNYTQLKSTYYEYRESQEKFYDQLLNLRYILTETVNKLINLKTQKELSKISLEFNERNYRIVDQQREKGLVSNIDFVDAKVNLQNANLDDVNNYYDFIRGMVELYYLLGKLQNILGLQEETE